MFLVTYMSTREEKAELLKTFQVLDINGDGKLSTEELIIGNVILFIRLSQLLKDIKRLWGKLKLSKKLRKL